MLLLLPALALAAEGAHGEEAHGIPWDIIGFQTVNVIVFVGLLVWIARGPVSDWLKNRSLAVSRQLDESARLKEEAAARAADIESRLVSLDRRVDEMKAEAEIDAAKEAKRIEERAHADAARVRETAERTIREEAARARTELRGEAAKLAVQLARETLKRSITAEDQERLAREFLDAVEKETPNG
jgi:F-type H+-transporting ATPase subunit b